MRYIWTFVKERKIRIKIANDFVTGYWTQEDPLSSLLFNKVHVNICEINKNKVQIMQHADGFVSYTSNRGIFCGLFELQVAINLLRLLINLGLD